jgi:hypothetical protein
MSRRRPNQSVEPSLDVAKIRVELDRPEAELSPSNPPLDRPSLAAALARVARLQQQIQKLEAKEEGT